MSRNFESNGPDVKIRGNAAHIAEKYQQLARDAQASGDSVMAENYLQHAEHYFRILSAAQAQMPQRTEQNTQNAGNSASQDGGTQSAESGDANAANQGDRGDNQASNNAAAPGEPNAQSENVEVGEATVTDDAEVKGDAEAPRKPRARRPRRKPQADVASSDAASADAAPGEAASDLPAFLTGGASTAAE